MRESQCLSAVSSSSSNTRAFSISLFALLLVGLCLFTPVRLRAQVTSARSIAAVGNGGAASGTSRGRAVNNSARVQTLSRSSLVFVPNHGQYPAQERFEAQALGYSVALEKSRAVLSLPGNRPSPKIGEKRSVATLTRGAAVSLELLGANPDTEITSEAPLQQKNSFLATGDPKAWVTNVPSYGRVNYSGVYKGVDLAFYGSAGRLEYDFVLAPRADASTISVGLRGADSVTLDKHCDLVLQVKGQELRFLKPVAYQLSADGREKQYVDVRYELAQKTNADETVESISFSLGNYDRSRALVIDPVLVYGKVLPSTNFYIGDMTADSAGNTYIAGNTNNGGPFFIEKLDPNGNVLLNVSVGSSSYSSDPYGIALDNSGNIFVTGVAGPGLPTTINAYQQSPNNGVGNPFLSVLKYDGSGLIYSTYFGGNSANDSGTSVAVDSQGKAYITGYTYSSNFPTTAGAFETANPGTNHLDFVAKIDPTLSGSASLVYSTLLGNSTSGTYPEGIAVDGSGNAYVVSQSNNSSAGFPVTPGAYSYVGTDPGDISVYVTKLNPTGSALAYSAYLGPGNAAGIAVDGSGNAYIAGFPRADDFPTTVGGYQTSYAGGFATELSQDGSSLVYSTFLSGPSAYYNSVYFTPTSIALPSGCASNCAAYVVGYTSTTDLPLVNPIQDFANPNAHYTPFIVGLAPGGNSATLSTYLGGMNSFVSSAGYAAVPAVAVDTSENIYFAANFGEYSDLAVTVPTASPGQGYIAKISPVTASLALAIPSSVTFPQQVQNVSSATPQIIELRNLGSKPINLDSPFLFDSNDFSETDNCVSPLAAGGICTLSLVFTPSLSGTENAVLTINSDAPNSPTTVSLTGSSTAYAYLTANYNSLSFADQVVGAASAPQTVTVTNIGAAPIPFSAENIYTSPATDYTVVNNCPAQLATGQSCQVGVTFIPTQVGSRGATLVLQGAQQNVLELALSGTGVLGAGGTGSGTLTPNPTAVNVGTQLFGTTSLAQNVYFYNTGDLPIVVASGTVSTAGQSGPGDFQIFNNTCIGNGQLLPGGSCVVQVTFTPSTASSETGTLTITDSTAGSPHSIALSGIGIAATQTLTASPSSFVFPNQPVGIPSAAQAIYIWNLGTAPVTIDRVLISGSFQVASTSCSENTLQPTGPQENNPSFGCWVNVTFTPTATGPSTGTLTLVDAATGTPSVFNVTGTGIAQTGTLVPLPADLVFETQPQGTTSAAQFFSINNPGNAPVQINSVATTGDFAVMSDACAPPFSLGAGQSCGVYISFTPTQSSGAETGTVVVGASSGSLTIPLTGTAEAATQAIGITPTTYSFGTVQQNTTAIGNGYNDVYVRNTGTEGATFTAAPAITGANASDFVLSSQGTCSSEFGNPANALAPATSCGFIVSFTPSTAGAESATLALTDSAGTQSMTLSGTGAAAQPAVTLSPAQLTFDLQPVGTTSSQNNYTYFANHGTTAITLQSSAITSGSSDFSIPPGYNQCNGASVQSGSECSVYVDFTPSAAGYRTGLLTFTDQNNSTYTVQLTGYAPAAVTSATLSTQALDFLPQPINAVAGNGEQLYQQVTLTNTGNVLLTVGTLTGTDVVVGSTATGDFSTLYSGLNYDHCSGQVVQPNGTCTVEVSFTPSTIGAKSGSITFPVTFFNSTTGSFTATLSGQGINAQDSVSLVPNTLTFLNQVAAHPLVAGASQMIYLTNTSNLAITVGNLTGTDTIIGTSATGDFVVANSTLFGVNVPGSDSCSGVTIPPNSNCFVTVFFAPSTLGAKTGSIIFPITYSDGTKGSYIAPLSGNGIAVVNTLNVTPASVQYQPQVVGTADGTFQTITVMNTGNIPVTFGQSTVNSANFTTTYDGCSNTSMPAHSTCPLYVAFTPQSSATPGTLTGTLTIADSATGNPHSVSLSGLAIAANQQLSVSQSTVNFGNQPVSTSSNLQVVYVVNQGTGTRLTLTSVVLGGTNPTDFTESDTCGGSSGTSLPARSNCTITVTFSPSASSLGVRTAVVTVTPASGAALTITLNGTGSTPAPQATLFPSTINLGSQPVNITTTTAQSFSVTNTGSAALNIKSVVSSDTPEFAVASDGCTGQALAVNASCAVTVTFTPSVASLRSSSIVVTDNSGGTANSTQSVAVQGTGTGTPQATLNPASPTPLNFPNQAVNVASTALPVTLTNGGTAALSISSISIPAGSFSQTNNCGTSLAVSTTCTILVTFDPQSAASLSSTLTVTDNANGVTGATQSVTLNGTGVGIPQATLSITNEIFSSTLVNTSLVSPTITLTNGGTGALTIVSIGISGTNAGDFAISSNNCGSSVAASNGFCSFTVTFTPSTTGSRSALLTVTDNANGVTGATQTTSLSGTGLSTQATPTITFAAAPTPTYPGANFTVSATTNSNGALSYSYVSGPCSQVSGGTFSPTGVGACVVQASTAATATFLAGSAPQNVTITGLATPTITFAAAPTPTYPGANFTVSATTNSNGALSYSYVSGPCSQVSGGMFSPTGAGTCVVQASTASTATFLAGSAPQNVTITGLATPTITFAAAPTPTYPGANFTVSATTNSNGALSYSYVSGPCSQVSGGTFSPTGVGTCVVQASTAATATFLAGSAPQNVTITGLATPTITFAAAPTPTYPGANFTVSATTNSNGALSYSYVSGPCSQVSGGMFSPTGAGTCVVQASTASTATFLAGSAQQNVPITGLATPTITFAAAPTPTYPGANFTVSATTNSNGALSYSYVSGPCLPVSGGTFSPTGAGTCVVQASTASTATFLAGSAQQNVPITTVPAILVTTATDDATGTASNCPSPANCSLRDALAVASSKGTGNITFDPTVFASPKTIQLSSGLTIPANTTITGPTTSSSGGTTNLVTVRRAAISINFSVFTVNAGVTGAAVNNLIITNGYVLHGGGINNSGTLTVTNSTISGNGASDGGGICNTGTLTVTNSTISGNSGYPGHGGICNLGGTLSVTDSTISGNTGGGIDNSSGSLTLNNSTVSANNGIFNDGTQAYGGGIYNYGATLTLTNSTVSSNGASIGGGIYNTGALTLSNSIVAGNLASYSSADIFDSASHPYTDKGGNLAGSTSSTTSSIAINLAPLGSYGGPTPTIPPMPGSPAICAGLASNIPAGVTTDQRGYPNINTAYAGYSPSTPCVDSGAVQTNYSLSFTGEPSPISPATSILTNTHFQAAVTLQESARAFTGAPVSVALTLAGPGALSNGSATTSSGVASYSTLQVSAVGTGDVLAATLTLTASGAVKPATISANSNPFNVITVLATPTITFAAAPTPTYPGANFTVSATTNSNGALSYSYVSGPCSQVSGGIFSSTGAGNCVVQASTAPTATFLAGSAAQNVTIATVPAIVVTTATDDTTGTASNCPSPANCSLRDALAVASNRGAGNITFAPAVFASPKTIQLSSGLTIPANTTITGPTTGSGATLTNVVTVRGSSSKSFSVFTISTGVTGAAIANLIITNGLGSIGSAGGVLNRGAMTLSNSTVSGNTSNGILNFGTMAVSNSTVSGNNAFGGGGIGNVGTMTLSSSTVSGNSTNGLGGGGIYNEGTLTVSSSTISGNSASVGGGIFNLGALTLSNSIVAGNAIAGNSTYDKTIFGGYYADLYPGSYTDNGGNQVSQNTSFTSTIAINLAPLGSYGGPTQTMVPLPGSPAICAGLASNIPAGVTTDQRGYPNTNTAYAGYSSATPCVDSGAVQTNYSLNFTGEPSPISPATSILANTHFHAAVTLEENGRAFNGGSVIVPLTLAGTGTLSNGSATTSSGVATYSTLQVSAVGTGDILAAHLTLTASGAAKPATISANSNPFNVVK